MTVAIEATIVVDEFSLGNVTLNYICPECNEMVGVDPNFFENAGTPICGNEECDNEGDDMTVMSVHVTVEGETR